MEKNEEVMKAMFW